MTNEMDETSRALLGWYGLRPKKDSDSSSSTQVPIESPAKARSMTATGKATTSEPETTPRPLNNSARPTLHLKRKG